MSATLTEKKLAHTAGRMAARTGRPLADACPYRADVGDDRQSVLLRWFVRGYRSAEAPESLVSYQ